MPTCPSGSSQRNEPITSTDVPGTGPHGCDGIQSAISSALPGTMVARWNTPMDAAASDDPAGRVRQLAETDRLATLLG
jgi:hypothetical protein